jgi:hypothetical protein
MPDALSVAYGELAVAGKVYRWGSQQPVRHTVTAANVADKVVSVALDATELLWSALVDEPSSFALLVIETDAVVMLELVTDDGADIGEEIITVELNPGFPLMLGDDVSYAGYTVNFGGGTLDKIETIRAKKLSGAAAAKVRVLVVD